MDNALWHLRIANALRNNRQKVVKGVAIEEPLKEEPDLDVMYDEWHCLALPTPSAGSWSDY